MPRRSGWTNDLARGAVAVALLAASLGSGCAPVVTGKGGLEPLDLPPERISKALKPRRLALLVGVQEFDDDRWRPLRFPAADTAAMAAALSSPGLGRFDDVEVVGPGATRGEIREALRRLTAKSADERDTVVVYLSSHGTLARDARGDLHRYLVARDTRFDDVAATGLSLGELQAALAGLRSSRKALILAACHSGAGKSVLGPELTRELRGTKAGFFAPPIEDASFASVVLAASAWGETAQEDERLGHDVYTHFLVEAITLGADRNGDGAVTLTEAHDYARRMTFDFTGGRQRPTAESTEVGADPIVLAGLRRRPGRPELFSYVQRLDGFTVTVDGKPLAQLPGGVALDPGGHRIQLAKGGAAPIVDATLTFSPGDRVELASLAVQAAGRVEVAPRLVSAAFLDRRSRERVLGPIAGAGAAVTLREWPAPGLDLRIDAARSAGAGSLALDGARLPVRYALVTAGAALPWRFRPAALGRAELFAGPRLSALWLQRRFDLAPSPAVSQSYFMLSPGLVAGLSIPVTGRLTLGLEGHLDWALARVDGEDMSSGFAEGLAGLGWRF